MTDLLIVVDMQRDFVSGALGSEQARAIVPAVAARIRQAKAEQTQVAFTLDTHEPDYLNTREGRFLPVPHCIRDTPGWALEPDIAKECAQGMISFAKPTFGSAALCEYVRALAEERARRTERASASSFAACARISASSPTPCSSRPPCRRRISS